jgi:hypothetical protein
MSAKKAKLENDKPNYELANMLSGLANKTNINICKNFKILRLFLRIS